MGALRTYKMLFTHAHPTMKNLKPQYADKKSHKNDKRKKFRIKLILIFQAVSVLCNRLAILLYWLTEPW